MNAAVSHMRPPSHHPDRPTRSANHTSRARSAPGPGRGQPPRSPARIARAVLAALDLPMVLGQLHAQHGLWQAAPHATAPTLPTWAARRLRRSRAGRWAGRHTSPLSQRTPRPTQERCAVRARCGRRRERPRGAVAARRRNGAAGGGLGVHLCARAATSEPKWPLMPAAGESRAVLKCGHWQGLPPRTELRCKRAASSL
jgi:hypothetical protein